MFMYIQSLDEHSIYICILGVNVLTSVSAVHRIIQYGIKQFRSVFSSSKLNKFEVSGEK
jgi:hypothetical protein